MQFIKSFIWKEESFPEDNVPMSVKNGEPIGPLDPIFTVPEEGEPMNPLEQQNVIHVKETQLESIKENIRLYDKLLYFLPIFHMEPPAEEKHGFSLDRAFLEELKWLYSVWKDTETDELFDSNRAAEIEDKLTALPFEIAYKYANPHENALTDDELIQQIFKDTDISWRKDPSILMSMNPEEIDRIYEHFVYMSYFIINTREVLWFDIKESLEI
jgi:hypothetical protein